MLEAYEFSQRELVGLLAHLDRLRIADLMPANRIKVRLARNFRWRKAATIQRYFEERLQREFFESPFLGADDLRVFVNGRLSRRSIVRSHCCRVTCEKSPTSSIRSWQKTGTSITRLKPGHRW